MLQRLFQLITRTSSRSPADLIHEAFEFLIAQNEELPPGTSDEAIDEFSRRTGMFVPEDLRQILHRSNGPAVGMQIMLGIGVPHWDIEKVLSFSTGWPESGWLPIAADGCGNHYVVPTKQEFGEGYPVIYIDQMEPDSPCYVAASSISRFFFCLAHDEYGDTGWPFDRNVTLAGDPEILRFSGIPLPWQAD